MSPQLHTRIRGPQDAPVLVLGGSLGTTGEMWAPQIDALSDALRIVAFDHRGHGSSPEPRGPYTFDQVCADVLETLDALGIDRFGYAGLSLGGTVGIWLASHAPDRVERLALLCTSAYYGGPGGWHERAASVRQEGMSAVVPGVLDRWFTPETRAQRPELVETFRQMLLASPKEGYASCCEALADVDLRSDLAAIKAATIVVAGDLDPTCPPEPHGRALAEGIAGAQLTVLPDTAHLASAERPEAMNALLRKHFVADAKLEDG